ncbi:MAG: hypothetical protein ACTSQI_20025 [Candidatus Helarchaeota archaeon]
MMEKKDTTRDKEIEEVSTVIREKRVDVRLYLEEKRKRIELEKKLSELEQLNFKLQEILDTSQIKAKHRKTREEILQELKEKHKFAFNSDEYPWMYNIVSLKSEEELVEWCQEWANFLIDYAKAFLIHVVDIVNLVTEPPFTEFKQNRESYLKKIFDYLATRTTLAEWSNTEKTRLRIYWRSLEEWSEQLFDFMYLIGTEVATLFDIKTYGEEIAEGFATLPARDIIKIIDILVRNKQAAWIDKKTVKFLLL